MPEARDPHPTQSSEVPLDAYSLGRERAIHDLAAGLRQHTGLEGCVGDEHKPLDYLFLADQALESALNGGALMLTESHKREMRQLARELT